MKDVRHLLNVLWKQVMLKVQRMYERLSLETQTNTHSSLSTSEKLEERYRRNMRLALSATSHNSAVYAKKLLLRELSRQRQMQKLREAKQQDYTLNKK